MSTTGGKRTLYVPENLLGGDQPFMMRYRANRATYWLGLGILLAMTFAFRYLSNKPFAVSEGIIAVFCVPRLHDIGKSGWIALGFLALEFVLLFASDANTMVMGIYVLAMIGLLIWLGCIPGDEEANKWGDPPKPGFSFGTRQKLS